MTDTAGIGSPARKLSNFFEFEVSGTLLLSISHNEFFKIKEQRITIRKSTILTAAMLVAISVSAQSAPEGITSGAQLQKQAESVTTDIGTQELKSMLDDELEMVLIDIRTTDEVKNMGGTIDAIQNSVIPRGWLEFRASKVAQNKDIPIVVYCGAGFRSPLAAKTLQDMGYTNVKNYPAGFVGWRKAGLPIK